MPVDAAIVAAVGKIAADVAPTLLRARRERKDARRASKITHWVFDLVVEAEKLERPGRQRLKWVVDQLQEQHWKVVKKVPLERVVALVEIVHASITELEELGEDAFGLAPGSSP